MSERSQEQGEGGRGSLRPVPANASGLVELSVRPVGWEERWRAVERLECASELVELGIHQLRKLQTEIAEARRSMCEGPADPKLERDIERMYRRIISLDERFALFTSFVHDVREIGYPWKLVGYEFTDPLYRYFSSPRRISDYAAFAHEAEIEPVCSFLPIKLLCQEVGRFLEELQEHARNPRGAEVANSWMDDAEYFIDMVLDPRIYLRSAQWSQVVQVCKNLVDRGTLNSAKLLDLVISLVERLHPSDGSFDALCGVVGSMRGAISAEAEQALFKLGVTFAQKRAWGDIVEHPFVSTHPITEFGYLSELLHRLGDFSVIDREHRRILMSRVADHPLIVCPPMSDGRWLTDGISRTQSAIRRILENEPTDFALSFLGKMHHYVSAEWDNPFDLWRGVTIGTVFGDSLVQHFFVRHVLQSPIAVGSLKGLLSEQSPSSESKQQLVVGLRNVLRDRRQILQSPDARANALRALGLLAHLGIEGTAAAPEVLALIGVSAFRLPLGGALVLLPWPSIRDRDPSVRVRSRALLAQWEERHGGLGASVAAKLAAYDRRTSA